MYRFFLTASLLAAIATPASAENSKPQPVPFVDTIPAARDLPYPGTMTIAVDATDTKRGIFTVKQTIPVAAAGPMTLLYPKWLPGAHSPRGESRSWPPWSLQPTASRWRGRAIRSMS